MIINTLVFCTMFEIFINIFEFIQLLCISLPNITLFFANDSLMQCWFIMEFFIQLFFLDPEVIYSSHTMFINAPTNEFTLTHLVTYSISRSRIRMKFYFVYWLIRLCGRNVYEWTDSKIQGCYMPLYIQ